MTFSSGIKYEDIQKISKESNKFILHLTIVIYKKELTSHILLILIFILIQIFYQLNTDSKFLFLMYKIRKYQSNSFNDTF